MGIDRFVYWYNEFPTLHEIHITLEDYLGKALVELKVDGPRLTAKIVGSPSAQGLTRIR